MSDKLQTSIHAAILQRVAESIFVYYNEAFNRDAANVLPAVEIEESLVEFRHEVQCRRVSHVNCEIRTEDHTWMISQEYSYGVPGGVQYNLVEGVLSDDVIADMELVNSLFAEAVAYCSANYDRKGQLITERVINGTHD